MLRRSHGSLWQWSFQLEGRRAYDDPDPARAQRVAAIAVGRNGLDQRLASRRGLAARSRIARSAVVIADRQRAKVGHFGSREARLFRLSTMTQQRLSTPAGGLTVPLGGSTRPRIRPSLQRNILKGLDWPLYRCRSIPGRGRLSRRWVA